MYVCEGSDRTSVSRRARRLNSLHRCVRCGYDEVGHQAHFLPLIKVHAYELAVGYSQPVPRRTVPLQLVVLQQPFSPPLVSPSPSRDMCDRITCPLHSVSLGLRKMILDRSDIADCEKIVLDNALRESTFSLCLRMIQS